MNNITLGEIISFKDTEKVLFASTSYKKLYITLNGSYIVESYGLEVYTGTNTIHALNTFNSIPNNLKGTPLNG
jgi:hypothetical protein